MPNLSVHRRAFVSGQWREVDPAAAVAHGDIASILVQVKPENLDEVEAKILALAGCEIHGRDRRGKLIVVVEGTNTNDIGTTLNAIAVSDHVLSAALVFHAKDFG